MIKSLTAKALKGDPRAIALLLQQIINVEQNRNNKPDLKSISEDDQAILASFTARLLAQNDKL